MPKPKFGIGGKPLFGGLHKPVICSDGVCCPHVDVFLRQTSGIGGRVRLFDTTKSAYGDFNQIWSWSNLPANGSIHDAWREADFAGEGFLKWARVSPAPLKGQIYPFDRETGVIGSLISGSEDIDNAIGSAWPSGMGYGSARIDTNTFPSFFTLCGLYGDGSLYPSDPMDGYFLSVTDSTIMGVFHDPLKRLYARRFSFGANTKAVDHIAGVWTIVGTIPDTHSWSHMLATEDGLYTRANEISGGDMIAHIYFTDHATLTTSEIGSVTFPGVSFFTDVEPALGQANMHASRFTQLFPSTMEEIDHIYFGVQNPVRIRVECNVVSRCFPNRIMEWGCISDAGAPIDDALCVCKDGTEPVACP